MVPIDSMINAAMPDSHNRDPAGTGHTYGPQAAVAFSKPRWYEHSQNCSVFDDSNAGEFPFVFSDGLRTTGSCAGMYKLKDKSDPDRKQYNNMIAKAVSDNRQLAKWLKREAKILDFLQHRCMSSHIVQFYGVYSYDKNH
jgi:hypothetical protein